MDNPNLEPENEDKPKRGRPASTTKQGERKVQIDEALWNRFLKHVTGDKSKSVLIRQILTEWLDRIEGEEKSLKNN